MNLKVAGFVAGGAFVLSFLSAIIGGVPFFDVLLRAFFWAIVAGAISVGLEVFLRKQLPELFQMPPPSDAQNEEGGSRVDISIEAEAPTGFVEELAEDQQESSQSSAEESEPSQAEGRIPAAPQVVPEPIIPGTDEDLPEIGSFLDSFRPQVSEGEADSESAVYTPPASSGESDDSPSSNSVGGSSLTEGTVEFDGPQDPSVLAKAVQTVMKKGQ